MHKQHRLTHLTASNKKNQNKIKDHINSLMKPTHTIWDETIPNFRPNQRQKQQLEKITDIPKRNQELARMEREFLEPKEQEQVVKNELRKILKSIQEEEKKKSTRSEICAKEVLFSVFKGADERQGSRRTAQAQQQVRVMNEQQINQLAIKLAVTQDQVLSTLTNIKSQLSIYLRIQNLEKIVQLNESLESYPHLTQKCPRVEETLDLLENCLLDELANDAIQLGKRRPTGKSPDEPPTKECKQELSEEEEEEEEGL